MRSLLERARRGEALADCEIIDMHGHLGRAQFAIPEATPEMLVRVMDRLGVSKSVCSHLQCLSHGASKGNDEVLEAMRAFPGRILGYAILYPTSPADVRAETDRCMEAGFTGIKLHDAIGFGYDEEAYEYAYAVAHERRLPVLFHTWGKPEEFEQIGAVAKRYGEAQLILAHTGCQAEEDYIRFARENPGVYLDLCLSLSPRGLVRRLVDAGLVDRVLWGTDATFLSMPQQLGKVVGADVPDEAKLKILSGNARRVLSRIQSA